MRKKVMHKVFKNRERQLRTHNKRTNVIQLSFTVGDFVLVRRVEDTGNKLNIRCIGPRHITNVVNDLFYEVSRFDGPKVERAPCVCLKLYRASDENNPVFPEMLELAERTESKYEIVECFNDVGEDKDGIFLHVVRSGLVDKRDWM